MSESNEFESAVEAVRSLGDSPDARIDQSTLLELYALYKQSTSGDCNTSQPSRFSVAAFAKWKAWDGLKGKSSEQCKKQYVDKVMNVLEKIVVELQAKNSQVPNAVLEFIDKRKTKSKVLVQKKEEYKEMKQDEKDVSESDQLIIVENIQHKNIKKLEELEAWINAKQSISYQITVDEKTNLVQLAAQMNAFLTKLDSRIQSLEKLIPAKHQSNNSSPRPSKLYPLLAVLAFLIGVALSSRRFWYILYKYLYNK